MSTFNREGTVLFRKIPIDFEMEDVPVHEKKCTGCLGSIDDDLCSDLPEACRTHQVRYVRADDMLLEAH